MKVIARINYPGVFEENQEYEVDALVFEGIQGEYSPENFEVIQTSYEACGNYLPIIGEKYDCRRRKCGSDKFEQHTTSEIKTIQMLGPGYYFLESQNNRYWLRVN